VVADVVGTAFRARGNGAFDEAVGVIDEELNPRHPGSDVGGSVPAVVRRLTQEERSAFDG
jgi:hypothetical protein